MTAEITASDIVGLFGSGMRAEYDSRQMRRVFTEPDYWPQLLNAQPVFLFGARGAGKTSVLHALAHERQATLWGPQLSEWPHVGVYWRVGTAPVTAFSGAGLGEEVWAKAFAHYFNLLILSRILDFADAHASELSTLNQIQLDGVAATLGLDEPANLHQLHRQIRLLVTRLEIQMNNVGIEDAPVFSVAGVPVSRLIDELQQVPEIRGKYFFVLIDEYEFLLPYQQRIINSLIRHAGDSLISYKIGMRETDDWDRRTLNLSQTLDSPADYHAINIADALAGGDFPSFAEEICDRRLALLPLVPSPRVRELFPGLSEEDEAIMLGAKSRVAKIAAGLLDAGATEAEHERFLELPVLLAYFLSYRAGGSSGETLKNLRSCIAEQASWERNLANHQYAMLFTIREQQVGIRKYFTGWRAYSHLADDNIRYIMQLVQTALILHLQSGSQLTAPVSYSHQTEAASAVGLGALKLLPSLHSDGVRIARFVLGLGRVLQVMARTSQGHTPEITWFSWKRNDLPELQRKIAKLLSAGVMNLAIVKTELDKMASVSGQIAESQYRLHPIFSAYFGYSYRSKRRMVLDTSAINGLIEDPQRTIMLILRSQKRITIDEFELPQQLFLFEDFFQ